MSHFVDLKLVQLSLELAWKVKLLLVFDESFKFVVLNYVLSKALGVLELRVVALVLEDVSAAALELLWGLGGGNGLLGVSDLVCITFWAHVLGTHACVRYLCVNISWSLEASFEEMLGPVGHLLVIAVGEAEGAAGEGSEMPFIIFSFLL